MRGDFGVEFDELRQGLRRNIEGAPLDDAYRVDLIVVLLKVVSELQKIAKSLSKIEDNTRPESMDGSEHFFSNLAQGNGK
jgi:hypothetical protein